MSVTNEDGQSYVYMHYVSPAGVKNERIAVSEDGESVTVSFDWPRMLFDTTLLDEIHEKFAAACARNKRETDEIFLKLTDAFSSTLRAQRSTAVDMPIESFSFRLPIEVMRGRMTVKTYSHERFRMMVARFVGVNNTFMCHSLLSDDEEIHMSKRFKKA